MQEYDGKQIKRLRDAMDSSRKALKPFREQRVAAIRQYVGKHYGSNAAEARVPVPLLAQAVMIYMQHLAARPPRALVTTRHQQLKSEAADLRLAADHLIHEIELGDTLKLAALHGMFGPAIVKVGLEQSGRVELLGTLHDVGQPYADIVDLDDFVCDATARRLEECCFIGNRYRIPLDVAREYDMFDKDAREKLKATDKTIPGESGQASEDVSREKRVLETEYKDHVELWDLWLPRENMLLTLPADCSENEASEKPLRMVEWQGPEHGPYHILGFHRVPNNLLPLAPVSLWMDLHELTNTLWRKLRNQAERQKKFGLVRAGAGADGQRIVECSDGDVIRSDDPQAYAEVSSGGIDNNTLAMALQAKNEMSYHAGNLDALGGLGAMSDTLGQDQLLSRSASQRMLAMQDSMVDFTRRIVRDLVWYMYYDPLIQVPIVKRVPGTEIEIESTFTPSEADGDFLDYNFEIEPYSLQHQTPQSRMQTLMGILQQVIMPAAPMLAQEGAAVDWSALIKILSNYSDLPELGEIIRFATMPGDPQSTPIGQPPAKAANTTRTNVRVSATHGSRQGNDMAAIQALMGSGGQANIGRMMQQSA